VRLCDKPKPDSPQGRKSHETWEVIYIFWSRLLLFSAFLVGSNPQRVENNFWQPLYTRGFAGSAPRLAEVRSIGQVFRQPATAWPEQTLDEPLLRRTAGFSEIAGLFLITATAVPFCQGEAEAYLLIP
jgi:hypothetical protein